MGVLEPFCKSIKMNFRTTPEKTSEKSSNKNIRVLISVKKYKNSTVYHHGIKISVVID